MYLNGNQQGFTLNSICLTITWDVFELPKENTDTTARASLTITWDVFE